MICIQIDRHRKGATFFFMQTAKSGMCETQERAGVKIPKYTNTPLVTADVSKKISV